MKRIKITAPTEAVERIIDGSQEAKTEIPVFNTKGVFNMATEKRKWTPDQIKEQIKKIEKAIAQQKHENKGEHFTSITPEEIEKKLKRVKSPMIVSQGWNSTTPGGIVNYNLGIFNPDPAQAIWLFAHVWVG